ncbi:hypothetical protein V6N13_131872 [Hibiscus sabdariffa]
MLVEVEYKNQYQHVAEAKYGCHVLIIDSITGGFEAGISKVGQTRKHVLLAFSIGVKRMIYCCNKMDATILNYSKASFEALYSDNIRKNVAVEDLKRGIIALNSKDDTVKEATNFTSQVIVISEELKMNLEDKPKKRQVATPIEGSDKTVFGPKPVRNPVARASERVESA